MELLEDLGTVLHLLEDENLISVCGRVLREHYDRAQAIDTRVKEMLFELAESEQERALSENMALLSYEVPCTPNLHFIFALMLLSGLTSTITHYILNC
jgi:hypothetical protein